MSTTRLSPPRVGALARFVRATARAAARRPKLTIALWVALIAACTLAGSMAGTRTLSNSASNVGEAAHAAQRLDHAGLQDPAREQILVRSGTAARTAATVRTLAARARALPSVAGVQTPTTTPGLSKAGGRTALVVVSLRGDPDHADDHIDPLIHVVSSMQHSTPGVTLQEAGDASTDHAMNQTIGHGLQRAEMISVPITLLILIVAFGALVAASVPLLLGLTSVAAAMGALGLVSHIVPNGSSTAPVVVLIGLAVGVDYSLFYIRRERAERRENPVPTHPEAALDATAATVGRAIIVAGATVIVGLAGLLISGFGVFTSMAAGAIVVVAIAVVGSLSVLPAVLALLGDRVDRGRIWPRGRRAKARAAARATRRAADPRRTAWGRFAALVCGHARASLALAVLVLVGLAVPLAHMHTASDGIDTVPKSVPALKAEAAIERAFPGAQNTGELVVSGHRLNSSAAHAALERIGAEGRAVAGGHGQVVVRVARDGDTARVSIPVPSGGRQVTDRNVRVLRDRLKPMTKLLIRGSYAQLTGSDADSVDFTSRLSTVTPLVIAFTLVLAFVLLVATFGSPVLAVSVMGLNLLSVGAAFGVLTAVFQHTWAQSLLGFTSSGTIINWLPLFMFVVLFGLSMDYTVLVLERAAEARREGASAREAAATALGSTGSTVTSAALVMVAVFAVFATLPTLDFKQLGVGLAAAIALDATIVRGVALPAALTLLGNRGIRPARRRRTTPERAGAPELVGWDHPAHATRMETGRG